MEIKDAVILIKQSLESKTVVMGSKEFFHYLRILHAEESKRILDYLTGGIEGKIDLRISRMGERRSIEWIAGIGKELNIELDKKSFVWNFRRMIQTKFPKAQERITNYLNLKKAKAQQNKPGSLGDIMGYQPGSLQIRGEDK